MKRVFIVIALLFGVTGNAPSQSNHDSLVAELTKATDTTRISELLERILRDREFKDPGLRYKYGIRGYGIAKAKKDTDDIMFFASVLGRSEMVRSNYSNSLDWFLKGARLSEAKQDSAVMRFFYNNAGSVLRSHNSENADNEKNKEAKRYYEKALKISKDINDSLGMAIGYNNIGITLMIMDKHDSGMTMWNKALQIKLDLGKERQASATMTNMAKQYIFLEQYGKALDNLHHSERIEKKYNDHSGLSITYTVFGDLYRKQNMTSKALNYYQKALIHAKKADAKQKIAKGYKALAEINAKKGRYQMAYRHFKKFKEYEDEIRALKKEEKLEEIQTRFQTQKKKLKIQKQEARIAAQKKQVQKENTQKLAFAGGFLLMLILAFVVLRNYQRKKKDNLIISQQKEKVESQKSLLEEKNAEIMDSINYSKRLQEAILPAKNNFQAALPESFILYEPKDVVAGDFYWIEGTKDRVIFAAADCTGHGVPGAMVSVVCHNALNRSVREFGMTEPASILDKTAELVMETFEQSEEEVKDGMDIALCAWDKQNERILFAGANNPLYHVHEGNTKETPEKGRRSLTKNGATLTEIKADKQSIGGRTEKTPFTQHEIPLQKGDSIYIFSDGFADQFGGPKGKKFKYKPFKELLLSIRNEDPESQQKILSERFQEWKKDLEQVDDVCVIGVRYT